MADPDPTGLPVGGIGPELPSDWSSERSERRSSKRSSQEVPTILTSAPKLAKSEKLPVATGITGTWNLRVQRPAIDFQYQLTQAEDQSVTGLAFLDGGQSHQSKVLGQLQGYVFVWSEDGHGKFRATLAADGQSFTGTAQLDATWSLDFEATRCEPAQRQFALSGHEYVFTHRGDAVRCSKQLLEEHVPKLLQMLSLPAGSYACDKLLQSCPLEPAACNRLLPLLRALGNPQVVTVQNAVQILGLAAWLGCAESTLQAFAGAVSPSLVPDMLRAACGEASSIVPSVELVLQRPSFLIRDAEAIEALAKDHWKDRWREMCRPAVVQCLQTLAKADPEGLRLSRAGLAALSLGLQLKEVHAALPSRLRFGPSGQNLFLDLHKKGIGPEGAARLEFPTSLRDLDLDLTRCNIRAVGAAALRFPAGLLRLRLILHKCDIGPEGAKALSLPSSLERLELDLSHCLIGPVGASHLQLPRHLLELDLVLLRCGIGAKGAKGLCLPEGLRKLRLGLAKCEIGVEGLKGLKLPPRLTSLRLDLTMCALGADGIKAFLMTLPKSLEILEMELAGCKISSAQASTLHEAARRRLGSAASLSFAT